MSAHATFSLVMAALVVGALVGYVIGHDFGRKSGRDAGVLLQCVVGIGALSLEQGSKSEEDAGCE